MAKLEFSKWYAYLDGLFTKVDKTYVRRTKNLRLIPSVKKRRGGKLAYAEWAHVIGIFQTLCYQNLPKKTANNVLDVGCGTGLLGIAAEPFVNEGGSYTGLDVMLKDIEFCKTHYTEPNYSFIHFDVANPTYAQAQNKAHKPYPLQNNYYDLVTALSVWTHLSESDGTFYLKEVARVLKHGGKAIISFFYLDERYKNTLGSRTKALGTYHNTPQSNWIFSQSAYGSKHWYHPAHVKTPEDAIGISVQGLEQLLKESGLQVVEHFPGNWKEQPGVFFQDIFVLEKP